MDEITAWWEGLTDAQREDARGLSAGDDMPRWLLVSLTQAGIPQAAAWWPASGSGPRFTVPSEVVEFVARQR